MIENGIHRALAKKFASSIDEIFNEVRTKKYPPLNKEEIDELVKLLEKSGLSSRIVPTLWGLAWYSEADVRLLEICRAGLCKGRKIKDEEVWGSNLDVMLSYLLSKTGSAERDKLISIFSKCDALRLRFVVAEYMVRTKEVERGLRMMIDLLLIIDTDHTVDNSIEMWFSECETKELREKFLNEKKEAEESGDVNKAKSLDWAASMIFD
jgi:hypothetical protein